MDYSELKTTVADYVARSDLTAFIATSVELATAAFNHGTGEMKPLRTRQMVTLTDLSPTSGVYTLPSDYLQYQRVVEKTNPRRELRYITPAQADQIYPFGEAGDSQNFTIIGSSLYSYPTSSNDIEMAYYQEIPNLSDAVTSNWLLAKQPNLYIHGCLFHVGMYLQDADLINRSASVVESMTTALNGSDAMSTYYGAGSIARGVKP